MNIAQQLEYDRKKLLQLDGHNPLLNYKTYKARGIETTYPFIDKLIGHVLNGKPVEFKVSKDGTVNGHVLPWDAGNPAALSARLSKTARAAQDFLEEQGINILFLGLGMLDWKEGEPSSAPWRSPLVLIPVEIKKTGRPDKDGNPLFQVQYNEEEVEPNYSLYAALKDRFNITLPDMPQWDQFDQPEALQTAWTGWLEQLEKIAAALPGGQVEKETIVLSFFAFTKYSMYKDLDPDKWQTSDSPEATQLISQLLGEGFLQEPLRYPEEMNLDEQLPAHEPMAVLDMDSSQAKVILEATTGRNMVVEGPPGTGKSQTIANLLADAVYRGKKVLFVAEKTAALDVVKRRLVEAGLGPACLELHGAKTKKSEFVRGLLQTLTQQRKYNGPAAFSTERLNTARNQLRSWSTAVNAIAANGYSPLDLMGLLRWIQSAGAEDLQPQLPASLRQSYQTFRNYAGTLTRRDIGDAREQGPLTQQVFALQQLRRELGEPRLHPFYQCGRTDLLLESNLQELAAMLSTQDAILQQLADYTTDIENKLGSGLQPTLTDTRILLQLLRLLCENDSREFAMHAHLDWVAAKDELHKALYTAADARILRDRLAPIVMGPAFTQDLLATRTILATTKDSFLNRLFNGPYRQARRTVLGLLRDPQAPRQLSLLDIVDDLIQYQTLATEVDRYSSLATTYFGNGWKKEDSDLSALQQGMEWLLRCYKHIEAGQQPDSLITAIRLHLPAQTKAAWTGGLAGLLDQLETAMTQLQRWLGLEQSRRETWDQLPFPALSEQWRQMLEQRSTFNHWIRYHRQCLALAYVGDGFLTALCQYWPMAGEQILRYFQWQVWERLLEIMLRERPILSATNGQQLDQLRANFATLDQQLKLHYKAALVAWHNQQVEGVGITGQAGYLRENIQRQRRIPAIRKFMSTAFETIAQVKPIFMMSPLSVASFLEAKAGMFDIVVFDEASQVDPVDAYGAIMRGKQLIVVGDTQQMPPTNFFRHIADTDPEEEAGNNISADVESIMGMMSARIMRPHFLLWHYRSRHDSLIATSNSHFYEEKLLVFPSPCPPDDLLGLHLKLSDYKQAPYEGDGVNPVEARTVALAVCDFAEKHPDKTLGVVAFNIKQAELIEKEIAILSRDNAHLARLLNEEETSEPFFVKNLEKVQGDERDVIFISIGYGKTKEGNLSHNFGPLSREGGHRRLNVLITRARLANYIFSNFTFADIDENKGNARGTRVFRDFLRYAAAGPERNAPLNNDEPIPMLEADIAAALRKAGYQVEHRIGCQQFRLDLAVRHPQRKDEFLLGIECDGPSYHNAQAVRDRDRLRQAVLEKLGWRIHHIWSTNWFYHREEELNTLLEAIDRASKTVANPFQAASSILSTSGIATANNGGEADPSYTTSGNSVHNGILVEPRTLKKDLKFKPYRPVDTSNWNKFSDIFELKGPLLERYILSVIETEAPILQEQVLRRITEFQGNILGSRIRTHLEKHLNGLLEDPRIRLEGETIHWKPLPFASPRDYSYHPKKDLETIPDIELEAAFQAVARDSVSISANQLIDEAARRLGFPRLSDGMTRYLEGKLNMAVSKGIVLVNEGNIRPTETEKDQSMA